MDAQRPATRPGRQVVGLPVRALLALVVASANVIGGGVVLVIAAFVLPASSCSTPSRSGWSTSSCSGSTCSSRSPSGSGSAAGS
nr:hypothetical protein [Pseudonocardia sp. AL041005-10]